MGIMLQVILGMFQFLLLSRIPMSHAKVCQITNYTLLDNCLHGNHRSLDVFIPLSALCNKTSGLFEGKIKMGIQ